MKKSITFIAFVILLGCTQSSTKMESEPTNIQEFSKEDYVLYKTQNERSVLLIVFPDLGGNAESIKESFNILSTAKEANISVLMMNFNHHLFLSKEDKNLLTEVLNDVIKSHKLSPDKVVIGGFSSGGIVSSLWSHHLLEINHAFKPQKTFVVDSPLDLVELFNNVTDVDSASHEISMEEAEYIINYFEEALNTKDSLIQRITEVSPFNYATLNFENIERLNELDFRIYTEPDSVWWKENRGFEFKETDSYQLIRFAASAGEHGWDNLQLIQTTNKGYRSNGQRHPHSWSIVDPKELIEWILKK
ncbi:MAG: hypothetical protein MK105_12610 [Crocinitomicaceae bacterium]|nr:hypothetical protein [Crocinitomicaceae bacterium]